MATKSAAAPRTGCMFMKPSSVGADGMPEFLFWAVQIR